MTEKRFYIDGEHVMQKGEVWVVAGGEYSADVIATALNELLEENKQLKEAFYLFNILAEDYHLTFEQLFEITREAIENRR